MLALKSRLGVRFVLATSLILGLAMLTLAVLAVRSIIHLGDEPAERSSQAMLARARDEMAEDARTRALRCQNVLRRAEENVAYMARRAAFCLDNKDLLGRRPAVPGQGLTLHEPNGIWTNSRDALTSVVYWDTPGLDESAVRLFNALSWASESVDFARSSVEPAQAAWLIMKSGIAHYSPNIHHVELMPPPEQFDYRDDICFTFPAPENNPEGRVRWTDVYQDSLGQGLMITAAAPAMSATGEFLGSAGVDIRVKDMVGKVLGQEDGESQTVYFLMDAAGSVLAFPLDRLTSFGIQVTDYAALTPGELLGYNLLDSTLPEFVEALKVATGEPSSLFEVSLDGRKALLAFHKVGATGWVLGAARYEADILKAVALNKKALRETVRDSTSLFLGLTLVCLVASVALTSAFFSSRVLKPLRRSRDAMAGIARGELSRRVATDVDDEIGDLSRGLNDMAERLEARDASLREAEARYRTMVDNAMEGIFRTSLDGRFVRANPAMARMLGYAGVEELKASVRDLARQMYVDPEDRAVLIRRLLDQGAVQFFEVQARRSDGETFWVEISCRLVADDAGQPRWIDGFATDVSERKARLEAQRELKAAEAASLSKSLFLANMSHEIRTPMNIILGATDMLGSSALTSDQRGYVRLLRESCDNLLGLISDVLDLSKIEAGKIELQERDFDLHRLLGQVLDIFSVQAADKGLDLSARISPELPATLRGDPNRLRQILNNLLGNAVKFTSEGEVVLEASLANAPCEKTDAFEVLFMVRDTGPGVPPERSSSIFEAFTQAPDATGRDYGGVGLGLAITRSLVEIMGGSVWCESRPGQGSAFWAAVPFRAAEGVPVEAESQPVPPESLAPASVLMVEDNDLNRLLFEYYLEDTPCAVTFASDGREGVEAFRNGRFDIVFMDVSMPVMDGLDATRAIREIERERGAEPVMVVALTAHAMAGDEERCRQAGCSLYLVKPVRRRDVLRHIQDCVGPPGAAAGGD